MEWRPRLENEHEAKTSAEFLLSAFVLLPSILPLCSILNLHKISNNKFGDLGGAVGEEKEEGLGGV